MKIEMRNGEVVCVAEDWKNLSSNESNYLANCYWTAIWTGLTEDGNLRFNSTGDTYEVKRRLAGAIAHAKNAEVEVTPEIGEYFRQLTLRASEAYEKQQKAHKAELLRERWENRKKTGCDNCPYCEEVGDAWFRCRLSGDELDCRIGSVYNHYSQMLELFHESGIPNEHCKDYYVEEIKRRN